MSDLKQCAGSKENYQYLPIKILSSFGAGESWIQPDGCEMRAADVPMSGRRHLRRRRSQRWGGIGEGRGGQAGGSHGDRERNPRKGNVQQSSRGRGGRGFLWRRDGDVQGERWRERESDESEPRTPCMRLSSGRIIYWRSRSCNRATLKNLLQ